MNRSAIPREDDLVPGPTREFPYNLEDFRSIAAILRQDTGITLGEMKAPLVYSRLVRRVRELGLENFQAYCAIVADAAGEERQRMTAALTTNVTRFFREPHHFEHLKTHVLPPLIEAARKGGRVRLWSAGCSSGEEPYSMALTLLSLMPDAERHDIKILAIDLDTEVLERGRAGRYSSAAIEAVPTELREAWFTHDPENGGLAWRAGSSMRNLVAFRQLNLMSEWPMSRPFHAIFCRNTVIYFAEEVQQGIWSRFAGACEPGGYLYIGHSERVSGCDSFKPAGLTTYRFSGTR